MNYALNKCHPIHTKKKLSIAHPRHVPLHRCLHRLRHQHQAGVQTAVRVLQIAAALIVLECLRWATLRATLALAQETVVAVLQAGPRVAVVVAIGAVHLGRLLKVLLDALQIVAEQVAYCFCAGV